jgi:hypothetical protein
MKKREKRRVEILTMHYSYNPQILRLLTAAPSRALLDLLTPLHGNTSLET